MHRNGLMLFCALLTAGMVAEAAGQTVYRCKQADGAIEFSDLPCESDIGEADVVDATHHQGHAPPARASASSSRLPPQFRDDPNDDPHSTPHAPGGSAHTAFDSELSRTERHSLEVERKRVLSDLRRRHLSDERRRELISELEKADRQLGIDRANIGELPYHDRDVYEDHRLHQGLPAKAIGRSDPNG